ncbi:BON domain-containing protein [Hymenobacter sp. HD11105]
MNTQSATATTTEEKPLADELITAAIESFLQLKQGNATCYLIKVTTREGIVELTGFTSSLLARERAEEIAKAVRGVRGVVNEIIIRTPDVPDEVLAQSVAQALDQNNATASYSVRCHAQEGAVTLQGTLQSWAEEQLVLRVVKGVRGVRQIHNQLIIRDGETAKSDEEITTQLRALLEWDIRVKNNLITIQTDHGAVELSGAVGTTTERDHLITLAYLVGATHVNTHNLLVAPWALDTALRQEKFAPHADEEIAQAVRDVLHYDPRIGSAAASVQVRVHGGVVMLAGSVDSLAAKRAAEQDADNVVGVAGVHNLLQVRASYPSPDATIRENIKLALAKDPFVGHCKFTVNVYNGKAQLYGTVASHADLERAADVVAGVNGVVDVVNHVLRASCPDHSGPASNTMVVGYASPALGYRHADYILEQRIRNHYYWSSLLHDQDINVMVQDGRVTLTGTVDTTLERKRAVEEAFACGAHDINNHLHVALE